MQNMQIMKRAVLCTFALAVSAVFAEPTLTDYYWATNSAGKSVSASFGDVANWWSDVNGTPAAGLPDACSCARFWFVGPSVADGGYTVTLPTMQTKATLSIHARDDIPITFDGSGNVFQALSTDTDNYGEHFISIYGGQNSPDAGFEQAYFENASFRGGYKLTDAVFTVTPKRISNGSLDSVVFKQGEFNFYDPEGIPLDTTFVIRGANDDVDSKYVFEPASQLRINGISFEQNGQTWRQTLRFNGNTHYVFGDLHIARNNSAGRVSSVHVDGGATLYAGRFMMSNSKPSSAGGYNGTHQLFVENGGTLVCSNGIYAAAYGTQLVAITNGAHATFGTAETPRNFIWGADDYEWHSYSTNTLLVKDSALAMNALTNDFSSMHFVLDNATVDIGGRFRFGTVYNGYTYMAATNSLIRFPDADAIFGRSYGQYAYADFYNTKVYAPLGFQIGEYGPTRTAISHGEMTVDGPESVIEVTSSRSGGKAIYVGNAGDGILRMKDGKIQCYYMIMAGSANCKTSMVHQTGGRITVTAGSYAANENAWHGFNVYDSSSASCSAYCHVILDGGEICAHRFYAKNSRTFTGRPGWSRLDANGGAVVGIKAASADNNITVRGFDEANLGERGLTIRSDYETRTEQDFRDMEGHEGRGLLRLEGAGVKKLYGTNSTESLLVCAGGKTQFLPNTTTGANAFHHSHLVVTNGATFSIAGAQDGARFKAVMLADAASGGTFEMDSADRVTVDGAMEIGGAMTLSLADAAPVGTHPLFTAAGEASPATKENWAAARIVGAAHKGLVYTLSAEYDSSADRTAFNLVVTAGGPLAGEVVYQNDGSWDGTKLVKFTDDSPAAVSVGSSAAAGAVRFDAAKNFTLSGAGPLTFSDRGGYAVMETVRGVQTVATPIEVPRDMRITVTSGATNAITGAIAGGGIVKDGRGTAQLANAANSIPNGVTVEAGLLSASDADALGGAPVTLAGGTLEIKSAGQLRSDVEISTCAAATAAVVKVDADVTMPAPTATLGAFIKRGAGRLTLTSDKNVYVCGQDSGTLANIDSESVRSTTTFDGEGGYGVNGQYAFGGFNVAEGELVLRGTAEDITFLAPAYVCVGIGTSQGTANPGLVVDHATLNCSGSRFNFANTYDSSFASAPYIVATNKATISGTFTCGRNATTANLSAKMLLDDSVQYSFYKFYPMAGGKRADYLYRNGSALYVGDDSYTKVKSTYCLEFNNGPATMTFSNSVLARKIGLAAQVIMPVAIVNSKSGVEHEVYMRDGSTLYSNWVTNYYATANSLLTVAFDDSEWKPIRSDETGDFVFDFPPYETVRFEMEGRGVILSPVRGRTFTVVSPFVGEGGMRKRGAGTLAFACKDGMKSWAFSGTLSIEEGAVTAAPGSMKDGADVSLAPGTRLDLLGGTAQGMVVSGEGTVANGTLDSSRIMVDVTNAGVVTGRVKLSNVAFSGRTVIDFGRTEETPLPDRSLAVILFSYAGNAPDVSGWQLKGTGRGNVEGRFEAADGVVKCTIARNGFFIIVR